jgi:dihydrodipicolinate synthase/N-acetylneuraminate lyase
MVTAEEIFASLETVFTLTPAEQLAAHLRDVVAVTKQHDSPAVLKVLAGAQHGVDLGTVRPPLLPVPQDYDVPAAMARLGLVTPSS